MSEIHYLARRASAGRSRWSAESVLDTVLDAGAPTVLALIVRNMRIAVLRESFPGERRVALVPSVVASLVKQGLEVLVETNAGAAAGFLDSAYEQAGAKIISKRNNAAAADCLVQVRSLGANPEAARPICALLHSGQVVIGLCDPLANPQAAKSLADRGVTLFALEMMPRITRAQSMDVLSSMATIAGYRAVLLAATTLPKMFPLLTTAAGTITPAKVFVDRRRRGGLAGHRHGAAAGRGRLGLRCPRRR